MKTIYTKYRGDCVVCGKIVLVGTGRVAKIDGKKWERFCESCFSLKTHRVQKKYKSTLLYKMSGAQKTTKQCGGGFIQI